MSIHRFPTVLGAAAATAVLLASQATAGNAHFIASHTHASSSGTTLSVDFKEAGLESGSVEYVQLSAHLDATYQCVNNGGSNPADPKKTTESSEVSDVTPFTAGRNGTISGTVSLSAPATSASLDCPNGQRETLTAVVWSGIVLDDLTSGASLAIDGTFSSGAPIGHGKG